MLYMFSYNKHTNTTLQIIFKANLIREFSIPEFKKLLRYSYMNRIQEAPTNYIWE